MSSNGVSCRHETADSVADDGERMQQIQERSNHDWFDREQKKPKTLKLESDQVVISNISKLLAQKKHLTLFLKSKSSHLTLKQFKQEKNKRAFQTIKTQKLSYIVKKEKSILQKEDLQNKLCKLFKRRKQQTKNT